MVQTDKGVLLTTAIVVGNPKPTGRTLHAARYVARELTGREPDLVVDLALLGPGILDWDDPESSSPTYKGTYAGC
jgi:FMN reductase